MLQLILTYACNLHCSYCSMDMVSGERPNAKIIGIEDWKKRVKGFPAKIREIYIGGGEPTLVKYMPELVNWLLEEGYHVCVFSNLYKPEVFERVKRSYRLQVRATFHKVDGESQERFVKALETARKYVNVNVDEIEKTTIAGTKVKKFLEMKDLETREFRYAPDGRLYTSHYELSLDQMKYGSYKSKFQYEA